MAIALHASGSLSSRLSLLCPVHPACRTFLTRRGHTFFEMWRQYDTKHGFSRLQQMNSGARMAHSTTHDQSVRQTSSQSAYSPARRHVKSRPGDTLPAAQAMPDLQGLSIEDKGKSFHQATRMSPEALLQLQEEALSTAPQPDLDYLRQAWNAPFAMPTPQTLLIIIDLNGTVLARPSRKNLKHFVKRPYIDQFLAACIAEHQVMIWSSAQPYNVNHMVSGITTASQRSKIVAEWNRKHLALSPKAYKQKVQVYKRLTWIWDDEHIQSKHPRAADGHFWDQTNTILIDDSYLKASSEPHNHVEVPEFTEDLVAEELSTSPVLKELLSYIEKASYFEDVSTFIRSYPFAMPALQHSLESQGSSD